MNRPNHAIRWMIAAMSVAACLGTASLGPSRAQPLARLQDPPLKVAAPSARDLRLQAMHRLMTPVQSATPPAAVPVVTIENVATEVAALEPTADLTYDSSCGLDQATGKVYSLPTEEAAQPTATEQPEEAVNEEPRQSQARRPVWSATVRQSGRPTFIIYRRPSLVLKTETQVDGERSSERMQTMLRAAMGQLSFGSWQSIANVWAERLSLPWESATASQPAAGELAEAPDRESRALPAYRSVLRNRTLQ